MPKGTERPRFAWNPLSRHGGGGDTFGNTRDSARTAANRGEDFRTGHKEPKQRRFLGRSR
ncbi:hypothetical protein [Streptomyces europaeiscabiei]|uniref:hypothetical protein n=1 Tax=Streptomyces europaeiscabiei TaxID=146819 RepID=UPI0038F7BE9E